MKQFTKSGFVSSYVVPALLMFVIPVSGYAFARHAQRSMDSDFREQAALAVGAAQDLPTDRKRELQTYFQEHSASELCASDTAEDHQMLPPVYRANACGRHAQFRWIDQASRASLGLGLFSLMFLLGCVGISFVSRELQYLSFAAGWNFLRVASALQVVLQGFVAVMLSFWVTAFFFGHYLIKLVGFVGIASLVAAFLVLLALFRKPNDKLEVEGEALSREKSPELWKRIEALCQRLGTEPPHNVLGGIDDNFFVTEHPVHVGERVFSGRSLFVSLSLLKRLSKHEADAILAHEMAHFSGGDTTYSKKLSPLLARYALYMSMLYEGGLSRGVFYFMQFYWSMFQLSLGRERRERELRADKLAADATSPESVGNALLKVAAYACYRARVEQGLFDRNRQHSNLNIAHSVAVGFVDYARGHKLAVDLEAEQVVPHPFDSHPSLAERFGNVGLALPGADVADVVVSTDTATWFNEIGDAERIEQALWEAYEARFRAAHEIALAFRYLPANAEERALVERVFPALELASKPDDKEGHTLRLDCEQLHYAAWEQPVAWSEIIKLSAEDKTFRGKVLTVSYRARGKEDSLEVPLRKLADKEDAVLQKISSYYGRYMTAKQHIDDTPAPKR